MLWFKHDTNASSDAKLKKVRMKYGSDGYAIYWYCLECIAGRVDKNNLTFNLEEDSEIISYELKVAEHRVEEIMQYMVKLDLFEEAEGVITCLKMAKRLDKSMTNSPSMRKWLELNKAESVMTLPDTVSTCAELEENRIKENIINNNTNPTPAKKPAGKKFSDDDMKLVEWMIPLIKIVSPKFKQPNVDSWANTIRLMRESDKLDHKYIAQVFKWANQDGFWKTNIMSPAKLRERFAALDAKRLSGNNGSNSPVSYQRTGLNDIDRTNTEL